MLLEKGQLSGGWPLGGGRALGVLDADLPCALAGPLETI